MAARRPLPIDPHPDIIPSEPFGLPLKKPSILSPFGKRGGRFHTGIDLRESRAGGETVMASRSGKVTFAARLSGYGNLIVIKHDDGFSTRYAHLKKYLVKKGQRVRRGEGVGIVGKTGRATTPHLHFEILTPAEKFTDPARYLF